MDYPLALKTPARDDPIVAKIPWVTCGSTLEMYKHLEAGVPWVALVRSCSVRDQEMKWIVEAALKSGKVRGLHFSNIVINVDSALALAKLVIRAPALECLSINQEALKSRCEAIIDRAEAIAVACRLSMCLLTGEPTTTKSPVVAVRYLMRKDGDHAIWWRVTKYLVA